MPRELQELSEDDPRNKLSYAQRCRIQDVHLEGSRLRREAERSYRSGDPESELRLYEARFSYALLYLATVQAEFRHAGLIGMAALDSILNPEIEEACYSLEIQQAEEKFIRELLAWESGW